MVVALRHPNDQAGGVDRSWLLSRPADVRRLLNYMLGPSPVAVKIDSYRIGFFGFSRGGYNGLILAGARVQNSLLLRTWIRLSVWAFHWDRPPPPLMPDPRIKAFVIVDPLAVFFPDRQNVEKVQAPVQLWSSEKGGSGVTAESVATLARNLPAKPDFHLVPGSDHSSFAMPCTPAMAKVATDFCADPPGFNRTAFHKTFNPQVLAFFRKYLPNPIAR